MPNPDESDLNIGGTAGSAEANVGSKQTPSDLATFGVRAIDTTPLKLPKGWPRFAPAGPTPPPGGLTLPFSARVDSPFILFSVISTSGGGGGLFGGSYGTDQFGDSGVGVSGESDVGQGVVGNSASSVGVQGGSQSSAGVYGSSNTAQGVWGDSSNFDGVFGTSRSSGHAGVSAVNDSGGYGVWARGTPGIYAQGNPAGHFNGDVVVTGDVVLLNPSSGDIAEDFDVEDEELNLEPGTVLIINEEGKLCASNVPYDTRVAGVVSGGGELKPAVVLQRKRSSVTRSPIALLGKAFCKVEATCASIVAGDLLTTSARRGYAMKVSDRSRAFGAVFAKALAPLRDGLGMIPVLVSLR